MQQAHDTGTPDTKKAAMNGLAIVGFGALIIAGIFLAIYAARYVPETLSRLSSAVILSSDNATTTDEENTDEETPVVVTDNNDEEEVDDTPTTPVVTTPSTGGPLIVPVTPRVTSNQPQLYGLPDLAIINAEVGYMRGSTFVEDDEVPNNRDAAVKFSVRNIGTNAAASWRVQVDVENEDTVTGTGGYLMPNGTQNFTVRIENPEEGENIEIEIDVDYQNNLNESNERNNDETLDIDIDD
jgi:CARDB